MKMNEDKIFNAANTGFALDLPDWAVDELNNLSIFFRTNEERMEAVIEFSRMNFQRKSGGPFAAGIFERDTGRLIVIGVNRVVPFLCSSAHAEIMAISLAQKHLGVYDLGAPDLPAHQMVVNWRPCTMCLGAVLWSGVQSLVISGDGPELEEITGFDEGPVHPDWRNELEKRGIALVEDVLREEAIGAYKEFAASREFVYNARLGADE
jgi:tRNA(Arg) A34 adenosine deaminase TadA